MVLSVSRGWIRYEKIAANNDSGNRAQFAAEELTS